MKTLTIIGFGRFGQTLYRLLSDNFQITIYQQKLVEALVTKYSDLRFTNDLSVAFESENIIYAVPISEFENVIKSHRHYFHSRHIILDVLSVKLLPEKVFRKYLPESPNNPQVILTHPMFGPDSSTYGFNGLPIVMCNYNASKTIYHTWKRLFSDAGLKVIEVGPDEHDKLVANSQGLTHFLGRLLEQYKLEPSAIDTLGTEKLIEIEKQVANDSWQLFTDLQHFNPYTRNMRLKLGKAYDDVYNKLIPDIKLSPIVTIGIQGGKGSFNEEAILYWSQRNNKLQISFKYLYTSDKVLTSLHSGEIDRGLFAIHNSVGGIVEESVFAMAKFKFSILEEFAIKISHALMIRKDANLQDVTEIMAHPQVFAQCKDTLQQKYPKLRLTSGVGIMIDHANVAKQLGANKLPKNVATMGSKILADLYNLNVVEDNLQDAQQNYTSFLLVKR